VKLLDLAPIHGDIAQCVALELHRGAVRGQQLANEFLAVVQDQNVRLRRGFRAQSAREGDGGDNQKRGQGSDTVLSDWHILAVL
jgi:hypothetical protein